MIKFTKDEAYIFGYIITMRMMRLTDDKDTDVRHTGEQNGELSILSSIMDKMRGTADVSSHDPFKARDLELSKEETDAAARLAADYAREVRSYSFMEMKWRDAAESVMEKLSRAKDNMEKICKDSDGPENFTEHFPCAEDTPPGEWCVNSFTVQCEESKVEIGVYREPNDGKEYAGNLILQISHGDNVILCEKIAEEPLQKTREWMIMSRLNNENFMYKFSRFTGTKAEASEHLLAIRKKDMEKYTVYGPFDYEECTDLKDDRISTYFYMNSLYMPPLTLPYIDYYAVPITPETKWILVSYTGGITDYRFSRVTEHAEDKAKEEMNRMWKDICESCIGTQETSDIRPKAYEYLYAEARLKDMGSVDIIALPVAFLRSDESLVIGSEYDLEGSEGLRVFLEDAYYEFTAQPAWLMHEPSFVHISKYMPPLMYFMKKAGFDTSAISKAYSEVEKEYYRIAKNVDPKFASEKDAGKISELDNSFMGLFIDAIKKLKEKEMR